MLFSGCGTWNNKDANLRTDKTHDTYIHDAERRTVSRSTALFGSYPTLDFI